MVSRCDTHDLDVAMLRDGTPHHVLEAVRTLVYHVATGGRLGEHARRALAWVLDVRPSPAVRPDQPTLSRVRPPEVY